MSPMSRNRVHPSVSRLIELDEIKSSMRKYRANRFRLKTLFLFVSLLCVSFALLSALGPSLLPRIDRKFEASRDTLPEAMMTESFMPLMILVTLGVGLAISYTVYRLGNHAGFFVFGSIASAGLIAIAVAITLDVQPFAETRLKEMTLDQVIYACLLSGGIVLPIASFCGWYASVLLYKQKR